MLFFVIISFYWLIMFINSTFILTDDLMYNSLLSVIPDGYIEKAISLQHKWAWVGYVIFPIGLFIKFIFISAFITTGAIFCGYDIGFKKILKVVLLSESLFILVGIGNTLMLLLSNVNSITDVQSLNLTSICSIGFLIKDSAPSWLIAPMNTLNLFELIYFMLLVVGIRITAEEKASKSNLWVITSYGSYLFIWIIVLTYLSVTYA
ncbi:hypothetical protein SAMN05216323_11552 [Williamwhitmania taraxaci]|uniref:Yip1 domain-containing protein n=2 Tax=Williamwhitmania taraxaci TaxID=1640674 RepID=A0A1G6U7J5_9BACT|nr:hypothetical protein SAMN05216323_11552 [Williamwhitmania taraxaci]